MLCRHLREGHSGQRTHLGKCPKVGVCLVCGSRNSEEAGVPGAQSLCTCVSIFVGYLPSTRIVGPKELSGCPLKFSQVEAPGRNSGHSLKKNY